MPRIRLQQYRRLCWVSTNVYRMLMAISMQINIWIYFAFPIQVCVLKLNSSDLYCSCRWTPYTNICFLKTIFCFVGQRVEIWLATDKEPVFNNYRNLDLKYAIPTKKVSENFVLALNSLVWPDMNKYERSCMTRNFPWKHVQKNVQNLLKFITKKKYQAGFFSRSKESGL